MGWAGGRGEERTGDTKLSIGLGGGGVRAVSMATPQILREQASETGGLTPPAAAPLASATGRREGRGADILSGTRGAAVVCRMQMLLFTHM